ncbi:ribonuclease P protein subunit POP4 [Marchantia polymorpha subsp. ruderalis]|nr:hypothetical protein MARPO_0065s0033 [Marchantia polymorpha]BBM99736.1 hypothetical protein Mp_1g23450 [Marchantia polymorpha subsp. ruderalis]|eukprot:PTQ36220.1 hypothetical protein MARPO_0065s0033 [Marchantia polymorpha]
MATSEKKKGRLEALERRLTATPSTPQDQLPTASKKTATSNASPSTFVYPAPARSQAEIIEREKTYAQLCPSVVDGPLSSLLKHKRGKDSHAAIHDFLKILLEGSSKFQDVEETLESRVQENQVLLLDNPTNQVVPASEKARDRVHRNRAKRSREHMSLRQHRKCGSYGLPQEFREYQLFQPLQEMWTTYAKDLLSDCSETMMQTRLLTADLHGAVLSVVDSKNSSFAGTRGVMVRETENTFGIVTMNNKFRVIPKVGSIFRLEMENIKVTLFGNNLGLRSSATKAKKQKLTSTIEL